MSDVLNDLKNKAYKTSKARFNASDRLKTRQKSLVYFITFLTLVQIAMSIALLTVGNSPYATLTACLSISFSVLIAIVSNSDSLSKDVLSAHLLHKCGMNLMRLYDKIHADTSPSPASISEYGAEYNNIINDCSLNHDTVDFQKVECQSGEKLHKWCKTISFLKTYGVVIIYLIFVVALCIISFFLIEI